MTKVLLWLLEKSEDNSLLNSGTGGSEQSKLGQLQSSGDSGEGDIARKSLSASFCTSFIFFPVGNLKLVLPGEFTFFAQHRGFIGPFILLHLHFFFKILRKLRFSLTPGLQTLTILNIDLT